MPKCTFRDCNILFRNRYEFKKHQRTAHQNAVNFKVGGKSNHLKLTFKGITIQKVEGMFHCPTCRDSSFADPQNIKRHVKKCYKVPERPIYIIFGYLVNIRGSRGSPVSLF